MVRLAVLLANLTTQLAFGLLAYTLHCRRILFDIKSGRNERNTTWLKIFAHGQLLVLVAMVVLAVFKPF